MPRRAPHEPTPVKGQEIRITAGDYKGLRAWKNSAKTQPLRMLYVIIELEDGSEHTTRIRKNSTAPPPPPPSSFEEACFQQKPEIEENLRKAAKLLAMCGVGDWEVIMTRFGHLCIEEEAKLSQMGSEATYFTINYNNENAENTGE